MHLVKYFLTLLDPRNLLRRKRSGRVRGRRKGKKVEARGTCVPWTLSTEKAVNWKRRPCACLHWRQRVPPRTPVGGEAPSLRGALRPRNQRPSPHRGGLAAHDHPDTGGVSPVDCGSFRQCQSQSAHRAHPCHRNGLDVTAQ